MTESVDDMVLCDVADGVATLTLNRPDRMNAWLWSMHGQFFDLVDALDDDPDVRAVVLTGKGRGFCAGMDMEALQARSGRSDFERPPTRPASTLSEFRKPVIAAINGACAGIGLVLALASDVRFVAHGARITTAFVRRGLPAEFGASWFLERIVGLGNAMDLLLSSRVVEADEAKELGLVNRVYPAEELLPAAHAYAHDIAANCSPLSMATIKSQVRDDWFRTYQESSREASAIVASDGNLPNFREGVASYVEKRPPNFPPRPPRS
jgi:enoyl-CoA hydratase/carnithine racemase